MISLSYGHRYREFKDLKYFTVLRSYGLTVLFLLCLSCTPQKPYFEDHGFIFNTSYTIKYESSERLTEKIISELKNFDLSLNPFNPNAIISKVNRNEAVELDDWFITVFKKAQEVSEKSGGAFDATVSPLINLWGFGYEKRDDISQIVIDSIRSFVGYQKIRIENRKIIKDDPRMTLNFSAIAKGYACDVIAELLEREGVQNYNVEIGREITSKGKNKKGMCWRIGIVKPDDDRSGMTEEVNSFISTCSKKGIATSGNYRNYYIKDGKKYGHTIDPHTGYPTERNILSATIVAPDCMTADAYATAFMVMGVEAACQMAKTIPEIDYLIYYSNDTNLSIQEKYSPGMRTILRSMR